MENIRNNTTSDSEFWKELEESMIKFFQETTSKDFEESGNHRFAQAMEASIKGGDIGWAWFCMQRAANLGHPKAKSIVEKVYIEKKSEVVALTQNLISFGENFIQWKYGERKGYSAYILQKVADNKFYDADKLKDESSPEAGINPYSSGEHVLIAFDRFLEQIEAFGSDEHYAYLVSKLKNGDLDKKLGNLRTITDMADLFDKFSEF